MRAIVIASLMLLASSLALVVGHGRKTVPRTPIQSNELNSRYELRGPLGPRFGELVTIVAEHVETGSIAHKSCLLVKSISGKPLQEPFSIPYEMWFRSNVQDLEMGIDYELRVFQDGGFTGTPSEIFPTFQTTGYFFKTQLVVVESLKELGAAQSTSGRQVSYEQIPRPAN